MIDFLLTSLLSKIPTYLYLERFALPSRRIIYKILNHLNLLNKSLYKLYKYILIKIPSKHISVHFHPPTCNMQDLSISSEDSSHVRTFAREDNNTKHQITTHFEGTFKLSGIMSEILK